MVTKSKNVESQDVEISLIDPSPLNHRDRPALEKGTATGMKELVASVKSFGLLEDIGLRQKNDGRYEIIYGERRFWASKHAGRKTVPAKIKDLDDKTAAMQRIDENLLREQLDPWEFALTLHDLAEMMGSQRLAAARMAKTEDWFSVQVSPLKCPGWEKEIREGTFTPTHARALTRWAGYPAIVTGCRKEWDSGRSHGADMTAEYWQLIVSEQVTLHSRAFDPKVKWQKKHEKELDTKRVGDVDRCFNVELFDRLHQENRQVEREAAAEEPQPDLAPGKTEQIPDEWKRLAFLATWFTRAIIKKLDNARSRPKLFALVPAMMAGSGVGDLGGLSFALFRYYQDQDLREEPTFSKVLEHTQHKSRANEAALAAWLIEFLRSAEPWNAHEAARVAATLGIDFATEWDRETCIDELARCYDLLPEDLRKIRGRYLPGLRPQDLPALLK
ncbi:ParB/RepB/Spo0J family partition protein [Planctomyces sp. SH-PL14]|uniref:ParB/RepB/Spo0J family partition protein n=1 Tax=Planctomyces sp. SH-PL14 TaxID=1632864 RepID=UPI00078DC222|nr:ParB/RepB/Spo0J family partition protein [Planctomyces sp. SH-PL14]AMV21778.1 Chromosome-partitioning protein Spo0J [Planctomyces sp. SH-PL14]